MSSAAMIMAAAPLTEADGDEPGHMMVLRNRMSLKLYRLGGPHGVRHGGAAAAERLLRPDSRIPRGLMLDFGVERRAEQDDDRRHPHPSHGSDGRSQRSIGCVIIGVIRQIVGECGRAAEPGQR